MASKRSIAGLCLHERGGCKQCSQLTLPLTLEQASAFSPRPFFSWAAPSSEELWRGQKSQVSPVQCVTAPGQSAYSSKAICSRLHGRLGKDSLGTAVQSKGLSAILLFALIFFTVIRSALRALVISSISFFPVKLLSLSFHLGACFLEDPNAHSRVVLQSM